MRGFRKPLGADAPSNADIGSLGRADAAHVAAPQPANAAVRHATPGGFTIAAAGLQDYVLSLDGHVIYIAGRDGMIRAYDAQTRVETAAWRVGGDLGGIDISVDGKTIFVVEDLAVFRKTGSFGDTAASYQVYSLDLATGAVSAHLTTDTDYYPQGFLDVAATSDGKAVLSGDDQWGTLTTLDPTTGTFAGGTSTIYTSTLRASTSHAKIAVIENGISDAPVHVYTVGTGITATHDLYADGVQGYNYGVVAIDEAKRLVAQGLGSEVQVYDLKLNYMFDLNTYKALGLGQVQGLAFSANGGTLFILDATHDTIVAVGTKVWEATAVYALGTVDIVGDRYGNGLVASADGSYLTFVAADGVHVVDLTHGGADHAGTAGADALVGGTGNDSFVVNDAGDTVTEAAGAGYDGVAASIDYTLSDNVEALTLTGTALVGTGNALANTLTGNDQGNRLSGLNGDDSLAGGAGKDMLFGGTGRDVLDGGSGDDRMIGGSGGDRYIVGSTGDRIGEGVHGGTDTVEASVSYVLPLNVEALLLTGSAAISGTGNAGDNWIVGNAGDNVLSGLDGNDLLDAGGGGIDRMIGGAGADTFRFVQLDSAGASFANADSIGDFSAADGDRIDLSAIDADIGTAGDQAFRFLGTAGFTGHAGELNTLVYQGDTYLQGDVNGDKLIDFVIMLDGKLTVTAADLVL